ncbi:MAG: hypothetical protein LQ340_004820 [Diploschistes diacapsis]|nr:MAG: hypothetical protein LQ340_004820 [Diploschistes diacapsis]
MDKSGSVGNVAKNIVAAPDHPPVREVEYGCEHIQDFMSQASQTAESLTNAYVNMQHTLSKPLETQTTKDNKDTKKIPMTTLRPTYMCLQCATISSLEDRDVHTIESRSGCLWCGRCDDFVYDPTFERIRVDQSGPANSRKRKPNAIYPTGEEDKFVLPNSNALSCQAGAPRGIYNMGQTCYLSVVLQAMIHNPMMRNYFLSSRHDSAECEVENCVACALTISFSDILATEKMDGHGPVDLLYRSWRHAPNLAGYAQQDAHEYFQSLLDHLHISSGCTTSKDKKDCNCLYHQLFYGKLRSTVTCLSCKNMTVVEDPIVDLSLDLRQQAKRRRLNPKASGLNNKSNMEESAPLELSQCLKSFTAPEKLFSDTYVCHSRECGDTPQKARKHLTIKKLPPALCIQLKRYEHNKQNPQKLETKLNFPLQLDMLPYTTRAHRTKKKNLPPGTDPADFDPNGPTPLSARSPGWYDLSTVVVHMGKMDAGHYVCYCRRDDTWFKFDDSKVTLATEAQVLNADAYLLFYVVRSLGRSLPPEEKKKKKKERGGEEGGEGEAEDE